MIQSNIKAIKDNVAQGKPLINYISTSFENMDRAILGFQKGELIIIASEPNEGKTSLILAAVLKAIENDQRVMYFLLGEDTRTFIAKIICLKHNIRIKDFLLGSYGDIDKQDIQNTIDTISKFLILIDTLCIDIIDISDQIEYHNKKCIDLVVVDNIVYVETQIDKSINIIKELKSIAYNTNIPLLVSTNFFISNEKQYAKQPIISDVPNSKNILEYSDKILAIYSNEKEYEYIEYLKEQKSKLNNETIPYKSTYVNKPIIDKEIIIFKNSSGDTHSLKLKFQKEIGKFMIKNDLNYNQDTDDDIKKDFKSKDIPDIF